MLSVFKFNSALFSSKIYETIGYKYCLPPPSSHPICLFMCGQHNVYYCNGDLIGITFSGLLNIHPS